MPGVDKTLAMPQVLVELKSRENVMHRQGDQLTEDQRKEKAIIKKQMSKVLNVAPIPPLNL